MLGLIQTTHIGEESSESNDLNDGFLTRMFIALCLPHNFIFFIPNPVINMN